MQIFLLLLLKNLLIISSILFSAKSYIKLILYILSELISPNILLFILLISL